MGCSTLVWKDLPFGDAAEALAEQARVAHHGGLVEAGRLRHRRGPGHLGIVLAHRIARARVGQAGSLEGSRQELEADPLLLGEPVHGHALQEAGRFGPDQAEDGKGHPAVGDRAGEMLERDPRPLQVLRQANALDVRRLEAPLACDDDARRGERADGVDARAGAGGELGLGQPRRRPLAGWGWDVTALMLESIPLSFPLSASGSSR